MHPVLLAGLALRDVVLRPFLGVAQGDMPDALAIRNVAVCMPAHLGDLVMTVPALKRLKSLVPKAIVTLVVGEWAQALALFLKESGIVDEVIVFNLALLDRSEQGMWAKIKSERETFAQAFHRLQEKNLDLFFDLRIFSPNAWRLARASRARIRLGFGLRGMAFTYHRLLPFAPGKTSGQLYLDAVGLLGGGASGYRGPELPSAISSAARILPEKVVGPYLVLQLYSGEAKRNVSPAVWRHILAELAPKETLVLAGSATDGLRAEQEGLLIPGIIPLFGRTTIPEFLRLVEESSGVISVDSFAAHLGLAYEKKVAVLMVKIFSDPNSYPRENRNLSLCPSDEELTDRLAELFP